MKIISDLLPEEVLKSIVSFEITKGDEFEDEVIWDGCPMEVSL